MASTRTSKKPPLKVLLLGDSLVGKSKLVERYLMAGFTPQELSTHGLSLFRVSKEIKGKHYEVEFWDTAGQERYNSLHRTYYIGAHACILVFNCLEQETYKHLTRWYDELCSFRPGIPCLVAVNKIDVNPAALEMEFKFATKRGFPVHYVSALDGTNVVPLFEQAVELAQHCQDNPPKDDIVGAVEEFLHEFRDDDAKGKEDEKKEGDAVEGAAAPKE